MNANYPFDRPVIILAAPRSGSTLLFETLSLSQDFWTIGGESHLLIETIPRFNPLAGGPCDSNALFADDATPALVHEIHKRFFQQLRDAQGQSIFSYKGKLPSPPRLRLLEKTPKNALRVSLLNRIFPDALFIYLYRNPRDNISSMMDAWRSGRFATYPSLPGRSSPWSLLLPTGWQDYHHSDLEDIVAFQWRSANTAILKELTKLDAKRWMAVSYGQQVNAPVETMQRIGQFCDVSVEPILQSLNSGQSKLSRYTLAPPDPNKWVKNEAALAKVLPQLQDTVDYIMRETKNLPSDEFDLTITPSTVDHATSGKTP